MEGNLEIESLITKDFPEPLEFKPFPHFITTSTPTSDFLQILDDEEFMEKAIQK